jgi:hypothetical protein
MRTPFRIELLSFEGCPNRDLALQRLRDALDAERFTAEVTEVIVLDPAAGGGNAVSGLTDHSRQQPRCRTFGSFFQALRIYVPDVPERVRG